MQKECSRDELISEVNRLVGLRLLMSRNIFATTHFYFGNDYSDLAAPRKTYTLGLECPWRIQSETRILVGSEDYYQPAEGNTEASWEPGTQTGHLQQEKLETLLGESRDGRIYTAGDRLVVLAAEADSYGGLIIRMTGGYSLSVMPCSVVQMEWILSFPKDGAIILMGGVIHRSNARLGDRLSPPGGDVSPPSSSEGAD